MKMMIEGVELPVRKTKGSCGYDIHAPRDIVVTDVAVTIDTGILMEPGDIPEGYCALIVPRSSMGAKGLHLRNTTGVIDADYTMDTIKATLYCDQHVNGIFNTPTVYIGDGKEIKGAAEEEKVENFINIKKNDRILQMILVPFGIISTEQTPTTERKGGYGSTGQ